MSNEQVDTTTGVLAQLIAEALLPTITVTIRNEVREALEASTSQPAKRLMTTREVAERCHCCTETVRRAYRKGFLLGVPSFGTLRFKPEDVEQWISNGEAKS